MFIKAKEIIGNKVVSQSGYYLGKVVDFEVDTSGQNITKYYAQGDMLGLFKKPLIISVSQVVEIQKEKIIVEDTVVPEKLTEDSLEYAK